MQQSDAALLKISFCIIFHHHSRWSAQFQVSKPSQSLKNPICACYIAGNDFPPRRLKTRKSISSIWNHFTINTADFCSKSHVNNFVSHVNIWESHWNHHINFLFPSKQWSWKKWDIHGTINWESVLKPESLRNCPCRFCFRPNTMKLLWNTLEWFLYLSGTKKPFS